MKVLLLTVLTGALVAAFPAKNQRRQAEVPFSYDDISGVRASRASESLGAKVVNQMIKKVLNSEMLMSMATPKNFEKFLNSDEEGGGIFTQENLDLIIESDLVQQLATPEMFQIFINSQVAKQMINQDTIKSVLSNPTIQKYLSAETLVYLLNSDAVVSILDPAFFQTLLDNPIAKNMFTGEGGQENLAAILATKGAKAILNYAFIHNFVYSEVGTAILQSRTGEAILENDDIVALITPANVKDFLASPAIMQLADPKVLLKNLETKVALAIGNKDVLHEIVYSKFVTNLFTPEAITGVLNSGFFKFATDPKAWAGFAGSPAFQNVASPAAFQMYAGTDVVKTAMANPDMKAALDSLYQNLEG